jgi:hypothetical protein
MFSKHFELIFISQTIFIDAISFSQYYASQDKSLIVVNLKSLSKKESTHIKVSF